MGVPALFRWLSRKYPKIISPVIEDPINEDYDSSYEKPNPNGELDNLYLDMNGIVHPCSHPENKPPPETEDDMFLEIFKYTDRILMISRPRKVLMIAVDGVAPRAKMNQQRARRFRSAQDAKIAQEEKKRQIEERELRGELIDDAIKGKKSWDSNAITPGTPFMDKLAVALKYWVAYKLSYDPGWADLQVIISDATVPGEGEHKIMNFIRLQRLDPEFNPNTKHCIYGLDADLIFLGLATHEPHFRVLREDVFAEQQNNLKISDQLSLTEEKKKELSEKDSQRPFLWLNVNILREYLEVELYSPRVPFPFDLERAIDDWVFICFFAGNDFLPHLPCLDVRDNAIDTLVGCWKRVIPSLRDYITCDGNINLDSVEKLLSNLATREDEMFRRKHEADLRKEENSKRRKIADEQENALKAQYKPHVSKGKDSAPIIADSNMPLLTTGGEMVEGYAKFSNKDMVENKETITKANMANDSAAAALKKLIDNKNGKKESEDETPEDSNEASEEPSKKKRHIEEVSNSQSNSDERKEDVNDNVRTWEPGYRIRYYQNKFKINSDEEIEEYRRMLVRAYIEGISWVLLYYYQGCPSWQWYYPFHYAPFAADFFGLEELIGQDGVVFNKGKPFKPYEQLMSVLPAASGIHLPEIFRSLMVDKDSEIIDFYPEEFDIDMNGAKMSWQGVALLPFIDENRLLEVVQKKYQYLSEEEKERNTLRGEELLITKRNKNYRYFIQELYDNNIKEYTFQNAKTGLAGVASKVEDFAPGLMTSYPLQVGEMPDLQNSEYLRVHYENPYTRKGKSMLLNGYISHERALTQEDRDNIIYGNQRGQGYNRFRQQIDNSFAPYGPCGDKEYFMYSMRKGGYRSFSEYLKSKPQTSNYYPRKNNYREQSYYGNNSYNFTRQNRGPNNSNNYSSHGNYNNYGNYRSYNNYGNHNQQNYSRNNARYQSAGYRHSNNDSTHSYSTQHDQGFVGMEYPNNFRNTMLNNGPYSQRTPKNQHMRYR